MSMFLRQTALVFGVALLSHALTGAQDRRGRVPTESVAGRFLLASSGIGDPRFSRTVILMVEHSEKGALGFVVNVPARQMLLTELMKRASLPAPTRDASIRVHYGGPVQLEKVFLLHTPEVETVSTRPVLEGLSLSVDEAMFRRIGAGEGPRRYRIVQGYSGWGPGQLDRELEMSAWIVVKATAAKIFDVEPGELWSELMKGHRL